MNEKKYDLMTALFLTLNSATLFYPFVLVWAIETGGVCS